MTPAIALLLQYLSVAQGVMTAGEAFWTEFSDLLTKHSIEHDKAKMLADAEEARTFQAREHLIATGELVIGPAAPPQA
jgi:hypothetical protein